MTSEWRRPGVLLFLKDSETLAAALAGSKLVPFLHSHGLDRARFDFSESVSNSVGVLAKSEIAADCHPVAAP